MIPDECYEGLLYNTKKEQAELLAKVLEQTEDVGEDESIQTGIDDLHGALNRKESQVQKVKRNPDGSKVIVVAKKDKIKVKKNSLFRKWVK